MRPLQLSKNLKMVPFIKNGEINSGLSTSELSLCENTLDYLKQAAATHRLASNFSRDKLHLDKMFLYSLVFDERNEEPVFVTGVQVVGEHSARVFSRYFMFPNYRTDPTASSLFDKVDDFEVLKVELEATQEKYPFIFWSRDKGVNFFKRLKSKRPDVFANWEAYPEKVEIIYKDNFQGIFYLNRSSQPVDYFIREELKPR